MREGGGREGGREGWKEGGRKEEREGGRERILDDESFIFSSEVWLGEYKGDKVAIKMLKDLRDAKASQLFLREASVMT